MIELLGIGVPRGLLAVLRLVARRDRLGVVVSLADGPSASR